MELLCEQDRGVLGVTIHHGRVWADSQRIEKRLHNGSGRLTGNHRLLVVFLLGLALGFPAQVLPQFYARAAPALTPAGYLPYLVKPSLPVTPPPPGNWLAYVNYYRATAELPRIEENPTWSYGDWLHARYIVKNGVGGHTEDPNLPWYTAEGLAAGQSSNVVWSTGDMSDEAAIDSWMEAPFHAVGILDPHLVQTGYGLYREPGAAFQVAAALDVIRGRGSVPPSVTFPIKWPSADMTVPLASYGGNEYPNPLTGCPGYAPPAGLPTILQIGAGQLTPNVASHSFLQGSTSLEHCLFDETSYTNPDSSQQAMVRSVLNGRDAIVLIPRAPLAPGGAYTVSITANGQRHTWSFTVSSTARTAEVVREATIH